MQVVEVVGDHAVLLGFSFRLEFHLLEERFSVP